MYSPFAKLSFWIAVKHDLETYSNEAKKCGRNSHNSIAQQLKRGEREFAVAIIQYANRMTCDMVEVLQQFQFISHSLAWLITRQRRDPFS